MRLRRWNWNKGWLNGPNRWTHGAELMGWLVGGAELLTDWEEGSSRQSEVDNVHSTQKGFLQLWRERGGGREWKSEGKDRGCICVCISVCMCVYACSLNNMHACMYIHVFNMHTPARPSVCVCPLMSSTHSRVHDWLQRLSHQKLAQNQINCLMHSSVKLRRREVVGTQAKINTLICRLIDW